MPQAMDASRRFHRELVHARAIFESAVDGMIAIDQAGTVTAINPAAVAIFGYGAEEVIGENVKMLMPEPHHSGHDGYLAHYLRTGERRIIGKGREVEGRRKDGSVFPMDLAVSELHEDDTAWFLGTVRDITARRVTEEALRRERDFAESLVETAQTIVLVLDAEGRIVRYNRYMEEISGVPLEEVRGESWFSTFIPEESRAEIRGLFDTALLGHRTRGNVNAILTRHGEMRDIEWFDTEIRNADGKVTGILAVGQDLTPRRKLEEQVRQAQKLEAIGRLAGGIAHDFNTLLGSIAGYAEILTDGLEAEPELRKAAQQVVRAAERGASLTRQLLAFSRRQILQPKIVDLNAVVDDMGAWLRRLVDARVELRQELEDRRLPVRVDATQIEQVIMNLVINACDAMPRGGRLRLSTARCDEDSRCQECRKQCVLLRVVDTGLGMDDKTKARIFDPFFTTKEVGKGTGLGLATVYGIVTQSQGQVRVNSAPGRGSHFTICFPLASEPSDEVRSTHSEARRESASGPETVLLVEDDVMFRELLAEVLETRGYRVWVAENAAEALELCRQDKMLPDLLVSDISMPGRLSGSDLAQALRQRDAELPILLMSGYTDETIPAGAAGPVGGASRFLQKPFSTADFVGHVRELLDACAAGRRSSRDPGRDPGRS